jgi:PAS domain S-box-containing protein
MKPGTTTHLLTVAIIFILLLSVLALAYTHTQATSALKNEIRNELMAVAATAAVQIDGDALASLSPGDEGSPEYQKILAQLNRIRDITPAIRYIYTMRRINGQVTFIVDADWGRVQNAAYIGDVYTLTAPDLLDGFTKVSADHDFTSDRWGTVLSGYAPVRNRTGAVVGLVGVDMDQGDVVKKVTFINWLFYVVTLAALFIVGGGIIVLERSRLHTDQTLRDREGGYRSLFEGANDAILLMDGDQLSEVNEQACSLFRCEPARLTGKTIGELSPTQQPGGGNSRDAAGTYIAAVRRGIPQHFEWTFTRCDGTHFDSEIGLSRIGTDGNRLQAIIRDVSENKRMMAALQQSNRKLNLLSSITRHDILNQITVILARLFLIGQEPLTPGQQVHVDSLDEAANRIRRQIEFTRIYQDLGIRAPEWFRVEDLVKRSNPTKIPLAIDVGDLEIFADPLIDYVFQNLADNAVMHGDHVTKITVYARKEGDEVALVFEDDGSGIPPDQKERIFERGVGKNTGLGLFLAREILGITGMTISETGTPGAGARFEIRIPESGYRNFSGV